MECGEQRRRVFLPLGLAVILSWLLALVLQAGVWAADPAFPPAPSDSFYAEDYVGVLDGGTKQQINCIGKALESQTGAQVAATIVKPCQTAM